MTSGHIRDAATSDESAPVDGPVDAPVTTPDAELTKGLVRRRILDAALVLYLPEDEPRSVPLERIAEQAGVSMDQLHANFADQGELMAQLAGRLYLRGFPLDTNPKQRRDLGELFHAYLEIQKLPEIQLIWRLGAAQIASDRPDGADAAYWHLVGEIQLRLTDAGFDEDVAHRRSLVLTPALMLVADRVARRLTTDGEIADFVAAACELGLGDAPSS